MQTKTRFRSLTSYKDVELQRCWRSYQIKININKPCLNFLGRIFPMSSSPKSQAHEHHIGLDPLLLRRFPHLQTLSPPPRPLWPCGYTATRHGSTTWRPSWIHWMIGPGFQKDRDILFLLVTRAVEGKNSRKFMPYSILPSKEWLHPANRPKMIKRCTTCQIQRKSRRERSFSRLQLQIWRKSRRTASFSTFVGRTTDR